MKYLLGLIGAITLCLLTYLNIIYPVEWHWIFTVLIIYTGVVKIIESFFTSKEKDALKYSGDWTLILTSVLYFISGVLIIIEFFFFNKDQNTPIVILGLIVYFLAIVLRYYSIKILGNQWAIHVIKESKLQNENVLISEGPYKYIRHPIYLSYVLDLLGIALISGTYYSIIFIILINLPSYVLRAMYEEHISKQRFGKKFIEYVSTTSFMITIPSIRGNKKR